MSGNGKRTKDGRPDGGAPDPRKARLAAALRANLNRRKAQARARAAQARPDSAGPECDGKDG
ncbi:MAG: hypothetical protein D6754_17990 [Alphaproteobacteria bacterium]|nr:MAG: hypothetical protein D6754_17990 [Alphaproteobacteria bacterium]